MAKNEIKTRLALEGEREYVNAMKSAADSVKVLDSEQKLAAAQFELTGDAQQYAADKARILKEKIEEQKKAVAAAQEAVEKLKDKGVDPNSKAMVTWRTRLNTAKTALTKMETQLQSSETELVKQGEKLDAGTGKAGEYSDALKKIGKDVDYTATIQAIDRVTGAIEGAVKMAAKVGKAMWDAEGDAAQWADQLNTAATAAGMDVETYQSWQYASRFIDTSVESIVKETTRLTTELGSTSSETAEAFNMLGIVTRNADGTVRDSTAVFWDAIDALGQIEDQTERGIKAQKLFGNSWKDLQPLIDAGSAAYKDYAEEGRQVAVVSKAQVDALQGLDDANQKLVALADKTKYDSLAEMAPVFKTVSEALAEALKALDEFVTSEEGRAAIGELNAALQGLIQSFLGEDNGKGTFQAIVQGAKDAVKKFTDALTWIKDHGNVVKDVLVGIAAAWAGLKVTSGVLTLLQLVNAAKGVDWSGMGRALGGDGAGQKTPPGGGLLTKAGAAIKGAASSFAATAAGDAVFFSALPVAGVLTAGLLPAYLADQADREKELKRLKEAQDAAHAAAEANGMEDSVALQHVDTAVAGLGESDRTNILGQKILADQANVAAAIDKIVADEAAGGERVLSNRTKAMMEYGEMSGMQEHVILDTALKESGEYLQKGGRAAQEAVDTVEALSDALDEITDMQNAVRYHGYGYDEAGNDVGEGIVQLVDRIIDDPALYDALSEATKAKVAEYLNEESGFGIGSNDRIGDAEEMMNLLYADLEGAFDRAVEAGQGVPGGMAEGIGENAKDAADAAAEMAEGAVDAAMQTLGEHSPSTVFKGIGEMAVIGLANGIYGKGDEAIRASEWLAAQVERALRTRLDIHSPSRVAQALGGFFVTGFAEGVERSLSEIDRATAHMASAAARPLSRGGGSAGSAGAAPGMVHVTLVVDKQAVGEIVAPVVDGWIGAKVEAMR